MHTAPHLARRSTSRRVISPARPSLVTAAATLALALAAVLAAPASAQERPESARRLDTMTVTARRTPLAAAALPHKIDVLDSTDLARTPATDVADALKKLGAVDVLQFPSLLAGIGIRGFRPEYSGLVRHTLILVDGRPSGVSNLATLDLAAVERIEVIKGPASALYGSGAMGGAVNVVTRRSAGAPSASASVSTGSFQTNDVAAQAGGRLGAGFDGDLSAHWFSAGNDYRIGSGNTLRDLVGGGAATKILADGTRQDVPDLGDGLHRAASQYHYQSGAARLGYAIGAGWRADVRADRFRANDVATPGDIFFGDAQNGRKSVDRGSEELTVRGAAGAAGAAGAHQPLLRAFRATEGYDYVDVYSATPFVSYQTEMETRGVQLQDVLARGDQLLTFGVDYTRADETSRTFSAAATPSAPYSPDVAMTTGAAFAELGWTLLDGRLRGTVGARADRVSLRTEATPLRPDVAPGTRAFTSVNPSTGLQYALDGGLRLHATAGRAFVAPTPFASAGLVTSRPSAGLVNITAGNPRLDAESSVTVDAGVALSRPLLGLEADVTYFHTQVDGRITSASAVFPEESRPRTAAGDVVGRVTSSVNAGDATMHGLELRAGLDVGALLGQRYALRLFGNATRLFSATERVRAASLDPSRFAGRTDFDPSEAAAAIIYGAESASRIRNVAGLTATAGLEYDDNRLLNGRLSGRYVSRRLDTDFTDYANVSDIEYPPSMVLDLSAGVRVTSRTRLDLSLTNLTDENYYEVRGYPLPGRAVAVRMSVWTGGR